MNWIPTHEIDHNGRKVLVALHHGSLITQAESSAPLDTPAAWHPDWELDEKDDLVFQGGTPPGKYSYRKLSEREPHYVVDDERDRGAFTLGEFVEMNRDSEPCIHEICILVLLNVGEAHTFGGGAMAETTIRRVR